MRGANYLKDRVKIPAGLSAFTLSAFDMVSLPYAVEHVGRFLPSIRWVRGAWGRAGLGWASCITKCITKCIESNDGPSLGLPSCHRLTCPAW